MKSTDYIKIYNWMRTIKCGVQRELYALLYSLGGDKDGASCTIQYLADRLNISPRRTQEALHDLQEAALVTVEYVAGKRSVFRTTTPAETRTPAENRTTTPAETRTPHTLLYSDKRIQIKDKRDNIEPTTKIENELSSQQPTLAAKKTKHFQKPTAAEVQAYCDERQNGINGEEFCDFYESKGWVIGKSPMKDWRAAVRTWEKKHKNETQYANNPRTNRYAANAATAAQPSTAQAKPYSRIQQLGRTRFNLEEL